MKAGRFTDEQIIGILREQEAGIRALELCREHGISSPTFYKWKAKFSGLDRIERDHAFAAPVEAHRHAVR